MTKSKQKIKAVIITLAAFLLLGIFALAALLFSFNYNKIYGFPKAPENGVMDLEGYSIDDFGLNLFGEWEFFYNKWIITDNLTDIEPDCILNLPTFWTGKTTASGETMEKGAFVSYRLILENIDEGAELYFPTGFLAACRVFINDTLSSTSGTLSKTAKGGFTNGIGSQKVIPYTVTDGSAVTIVIELSYNTYGGLNFIPWLFNNKVDASTGGKIIDFSSHFIPGIMFAFVIFSFAMNMGNKKKLRDLSLPIFILLAFVQLLTVPETFAWTSKYFSFISYPFIYNLCLTLFHIFPATFFIHLIVQKIIILKKHEFVLFSGISAALLVLFYALWGTALQFVPLLLLACSYLFIFYKLALAAVNKKPYALFHLLMMFPLLVIMLLVPFDLLGVINYPLSPGFSWMLLLIAAVFTGLSYKIIRDNAKQALKAADFEIQNAILQGEIGKVKQQALQAQIKPHFIFNALSSIQALYEKDKRAGSNSLDMFASHLRQNVDSSIHDTITFEQEIINIQNYVELENLRLNNKLTLLLDIEYTDFELPALSLQPFIENSIKYAGTQEMDEGYMLIESKCIEDKIILRVCDNGNGFDVGGVRDRAVGMKNCIERLRLILNAETEVYSALGEGTIVTIKIPLKENA